MRRAHNHPTTKPKAKTMKINRKPAAELTRAELLALLSAFINQRPGLEYANYGDPTSYRAESRSITADGHDARALLAAVAWRDSIDARLIREALQGSGRLTLSEDGRLDYCTGQYFPTEYRPAVCRVLVGLLWDYWRENYAATNLNAENRYQGAGDYIRKTARRELGQRIARRYFR